MACAHAVPDPPRVPIASYWPRDRAPDGCGYRDREERLRSQPSKCGYAPREVRAWGSTPREPPPASRCPTRVRVLGDRVVAEPSELGASFDPVPWGECVPRQYMTGARHVMKVDDGWLVAYEGVFASEVFWASTDGQERKTISTARVLGFARAPSGAVLALASGRARLGRGAVVRFEHHGRGDWNAELVAILPIEPTGAALDDNGVIVGFAQGFVFRVDESGRLENVHYVARDIGRVTSIAKGSSGSYYLGLECGVLRIELEQHSEVWWSARDGASGRWSSCGS